MSKYREALDNIGEYFEETKNWDLMKNVSVLAELVNKYKPSEHYTKRQLIDELDKVYTLVKQHDDNLIHYVDIYRLIERLIEDE